MTKPELINEVAAKTKMKKKDIAAVIDAILEAITASLKKKNAVSLVGFGTFDLRSRSARTGRNPRTGQEIKIAATRVAVFRPGRKLREAVTK
jgi:DNA-binding protein HU-beta